MKNVRLSHYTTLAFAEILPKVMLQIFILILPLFLDLDSFGELYLVLAFVAFINIFGEHVLSKFIISNINISHYVKPTLVYSLAVFLALIGFIFFVEKIDALKYYSIAEYYFLDLIFLGSMLAVQLPYAYLKKNLNYHKLAILRNIHTISFVIILSILLSNNMFTPSNYLISLTFVNLIIILFSLTTMDFKTKISISGSWSGVSAGQLVTLSYFVVTGLTSWAFSWLDAMYVSEAFGSDKVAIYRTSHHLAFTAYSFMFIPLNTLVFTKISKALQAGEVIDKQKLLSIYKMVFLVCLLLNLFVTPLGYIYFSILGGLWMSYYPIFLAFAVINCFSYFVFLNSDLYKAYSLVRIEVLSNMFMLILYFCILINIEKFTFTQFVIVRAAFSAFALIIHLYLFKMYILPILKSLFYPMILTAFSLLVVVVCSMLYSLNVGFYFGFSVVVCLLLIAKYWQDVRNLILFLKT